MYFHSDRLLKRYLGYRRPTTIAYVFLFALGILTILAIPLVNAGKLPGANYRDESLNLAVGELLHGRYPYYVTASGKEPITPLPGSLLLAIPFVLVGSSGFQNCFWLFVFFRLCVRYLRNSTRALALLLSVFAGAPVIVRELSSGSDLLSNTIWILASVMAIENCDHFSPPINLFIAVAAGIGFSSRPNFVLLAPLLYSALIRRRGIRCATSYVLVAAAVWGIVTLPFYLYDPGGFSPLHVVRFVNRFDTVLPYSGIILPGASFLASILLALKKTNGPGSLLMRSAVVLGIAPVLGMCLTSIAERRFEVGPYSNFSLMVLPFATVALWRGRPCR